MVTVNAYLVDWLLVPIGSNPDDDDYRSNNPLVNIDLNDEASALGLIRSVIKPHFLRGNAEDRNAIKESLRYVLATKRLTADGRDFFEAIFDGVYSVIEPPSVPKRFFVQIWFELFPNEEPWLDPTEQYDVKDDPIAAFQVWTRWR